MTVSLSILSKRFMPADLTERVSRASKAVISGREITAVCQLLMVKSALLEHTCKINLVKSISLRKKRKNLQVHKHKI